MSEVTSREIIRRCVHFEGPPRFGLYYSAFGRNDTVDVFDFFIKDENGVDPWGITWTVHPDVPSIGIIKDHPLQSDPDLGKIRALDPKAYADQVVESLGALSAEDRDKYRIISTSGRCIPTARARCTAFRITRSEWPRV